MWRRSGVALAAVILAGTASLVLPATKSLVLPLANASFTGSTDTNATIRTSSCFFTRLWCDSDTPATPDYNDSAAVELGLAFRSEVRGQITGVRFYKGGSSNGGVHVGHLWGLDGTMLATVTFTGETSSGWQQAGFASPVTISPGVTYLVSYYDPQGHYSVDSDLHYRDRGPLHVDPFDPGDPNGSQVSYFHYGAGGGYPDNNGLGRNYWVDVVFAPSAPSAPACSPCSLFAPGTTPADPDANDNLAVELGVKFHTEVPGVIAGVRFYKSANNTGVHVAHLWSEQNTRPRTGAQLAAATFSGESAAGWQQVSFAAPVRIMPGATYVASYYAPNGHYAGDHGGLTSQLASPPLYALADPEDYGNGVYHYGSMSFPTDTYQANNYYVDVVFVPDDPAPTGIWSDRSYPDNPAVQDGLAGSQGVELGTRFYSALPGKILGVRFYKTTPDTGSHVGHLWAADGSLLGTATFTHETAWGWQRADFASPVTISARTQYVVSYHTDGDIYSGDRYAFDYELGAGPLHATQDGTQPNGVYAYGPSAFPAATFQGSNYWVDVAFTP